MIFKHSHVLKENTNCFSHNMQKKCNNSINCTIRRRHSTYLMNEGVNEFSVTRYWVQSY